MKLTSNNTINHQLSLLDAAPAEALDEATRLRANARLEQILATQPESKSGSVRRSRVRPVHLAWLGAVPLAAAAVVASSWVHPGLLGVDEAAYASWTPVVQTLTTHDRDVADAACREQHLDVPQAVISLAERRGDWVFLLYTGSEPVVASCLTRLPPGSDDASDTDSSTAGGQGAVPVGAQFTQGPISQYTGRTGLLGLRERPTASFTSGDVGPEVAEVTIHTADGQIVQATVTGGRYVAWWPGLAFGDDTEGNGGPAPDLTYDLTLSDGTVVRDASWTEPE